MRRFLTAALIAFALAAFALPAIASNDQYFAQQWGLQTIRAPQAWSAARGNAVIIAIIDTGVDLSHPDLKSRLVPGANFVEPGKPPQDDCGHGTHVAGIAAAATDNGAGVAGAAPGAKIMPVRVMGDDGSGDCGGSDASPAIRWAVDHGARVINMSFGEDTQPVFGPSFSDAIRYAWSKGAIPVIAAGNQFILSSGFGDEPAIVVAATDRNDDKPLYSSGVGSAQWGLSAPGGAGNVLGPRDATVDILSTYSGGGYATMAGTSMAAPFVSGAAAVLLSMGMSNEQAVQRLLATADEIGSASTFGHGRVNLERATRSSPRASGTNVSPAPESTPQSTQAWGSQTRSQDSSPDDERASVSQPAASPRVVTPEATASSSAAYAAPSETNPPAAGGPLLPIAVGIVGLAAASAGAWGLYRFRHPGRL